MGCRSVRQPAELVRCVSDGAGGLVVSRLAAGRGAWLCRTGDGPDPDCSATALRRGGFGRALRTTVDPVRAAQNLAAEHHAP